MDFCVKCGKENVYKKNLCRECYEHEYEGEEEKEGKEEEKVEKEKGEQKHGLYFEAILQIRNSNKKLNAAIRELLRKEEARITKKTNVKGGYDLYLTDKKKARKIGENLKKKFAGVLKISRTLYGYDKQTSKKLYRMTVLFKALPFQKGETFEFKGHKYKLLSVRKDVHVLNLDDNKKERLTFDELERYGVF